MADKAARIKLTTPEFRGSYVTLHKPRAQKGDDGVMQEPKYSILIALKKTDPATVPFLKQLMDALAASSKAFHGGEGVPKEKQKNYPIKDGKTMDGDQFNDYFCIRASSKVKPECIDKSGRLIISAEEAYSGAWYRACISPFSWTSERGGKGCSVGLLSVLKVKDDEKFGAGSDAKGDFSSFLEAGAADPSGLGDLGL